MSNAVGANSADERFTKMKSYVPIAAALIAVLNALPHPGDDCLHVPIAALRCCWRLPFSHFPFSSAAKSHHPRHRLRQASASA